MALLVLRLRRNCRKSPFHCADIASTAGRFRAGKATLILLQVILRCGGVGSWAAWQRDHRFGRAPVITQGPEFGIRIYFACGSKGYGLIGTDVIPFILESPIADSAYGANSQDCILESACALPV